MASRDPTTQVRFNNLRVRTTKQLNKVIQDSASFKKEMNNLNNDREPLTSVPMTMSLLLDETNTAADTKSYHVRSTNDNRRKEEDDKPKIEDFEIGQVVGAGNFAKVYKAFNKKSEEWVVLKVLKKESVAAMKHVDHIINERHVLKQLTTVNEHAQ